MSKKMGRHESSENHAGPRTARSNAAGPFILGTCPGRVKTNKPYSVTEEQFYEKKKK